MGPINARVFVFAPMVLATGCLFSPANGSELPTKETPVTFDGATGLDQSAYMIGSSTPTGAFEEFAEIEADSSGLFTEDLVIPAWLWRPMCDRTGGWETFVRAQNPARTGYLATFDDPSISGFSGEECINEHLSDGDYAGALFECASPDSPTVRLYAASGGTGPSTMVGDVVIDSPADAESLACLQTLEGSLTIDDGVFHDITLPLLELVTGDITIVYTREPGMFGRKEVVHLPALHTVGGDIDLQVIQGGPGQWASDDFGMEALTSLGGDLSIQIESFNCTPRGFDSLASIAGSVFYDSCSADGSGASLLPALTAIGTNLEITFGGSTQDFFFNNLLTIDGDLIVHNGVWNANFDGTGRMFNSVTSVGGTLHVVDISIFGAVPRAFDELAHAGTLDWDSSGTMASIAAGAVTLDGLRLNDNTWLTELPTLMSKYTISTNAPITITNNPNLPQCDAQTWANSLPGHVGPVSISGNLACARNAPPGNMSAPR